MRSACGSSLADFTLAVSIENHICLATDTELQQQHCPTDTIIHDYSPSNIGLYAKPYQSIKTHLHLGLCS